MSLPIRSLLALTILVVILAACGTTASTPEPTVPPTPAPTEPEATPTQAPSQAPSEAPSETPDAPEVTGTLTIVDGASVGGPGGSIADSLDSGVTGPMLVNGVLFNDGSGKLYLASSITDAHAPTFGGPMLEVINYPEGGAEWDPAHAADTGLVVAGDVLYFESSQLFGVVEQ